MSLDLLLRLLTRKSDDVPHQITVFTSSATRGEPAEFLWGIVYRKITHSADPKSGSQLVPKEHVELLYKGAYGEIYLVRPSSKEDIRQIAEITGIRDRRYAIFGSAKLYKAFFEVLNADKIEGKINEDDYMRMFNTIKEAEAFIFARSRDYFFRKILGRNMLSYFEKDREVSRMIDHYVRRARLAMEEPVAIL